MVDINTHTQIDQRLCGRPLDVGEGCSRVSLETMVSMAVDGHGLVHGGFIFGLADHAAMIAVNDPNVVLGGADVKFLKPVQVGQEVVAEARITGRKGKKCNVAVTATVKKDKDEEEVFQGEFVCFILEKHVLA